MPPNYCIYKFNGNSGVYDNEKKIFIIEPLYEFIEYCHETNYYLVCKKMSDKSLMYGFINCNNEIVIPFNFCYAQVFSEGYAVVGVLIGSKNKFGFIDMKGDFVISCEYDYAESFTKGFAIVSIGGKVADDVINNSIVNFKYSGGKYSLINKLNEKQFDFQFKNLKAHRDTISTYWTSGNELLIKIDNGALRIVSLNKTRYNFDYIKYAGNGFVIGVHRKTDDDCESGESYFLIDDDGNTCVDNSKIYEARGGAYNYCTKFYEGIAAVKLVQRGYTTFYPNEELFYFSENYIIENEGLDLANIPYFNSFWYFINDKIRRVSKHNFEDVGFFREGLCPVKYNKKWGYINKEGQIVIEPKFEYAKPFMNSYAIVKTDENLWSIIDLNGDEIVSKISAINIGNYCSGLFWIELDLEIIERMERRIIFKMHKEEYSANPNATLMKYSKLSSKLGFRYSSLFGYINLEGEQIIEPSFHYATDFVGGFAIVKQNEFSFWIDKNGKKMYSFSYSENNE